MKYAVLGRTGMRVSRVGIGTATFGVLPREGDAPRLIGRALDLGINLFDTANSYGNQTRFDREGAPLAAQRQPAEVILGKALQGHRHEVVITSKVMEPVGTGPNDRGLSRNHIMTQIEETLRRLGTDYIDIYYAHHPDPSTPIDQPLRAFDDLIRQGKVRYCALSTFPAWQVVEALWVAERLGLNAPVCDQVQYNLVTREVERDIAPACLRFGMTLTAYSPVAGGLLTGREIFNRPLYGRERWGGARFTEEQLRMAGELDDLARESGHSATHLSLAWLLSRPAVTTAIIGPENEAELEMNAAATDLELDAELLDRIDSISR